MGVTYSGEVFQFLLLQKDLPAGRFTHLSRQGAKDRPISSPRGHASKTVKTGPMNWRFSFDNPGAMRLQVISIYTNPP
ncbi:hypothetical protein AN476_20505 [Phaeobacter sp. 11ANDIMAR09]|nr:hypothetical protein AN476_20505 [Phaeobacter sp. 11ANDIMAR09]